MELAIEAIAAPQPVNVQLDSETRVVRRHVPLLIRPLACRRFRPRQADPRTASRSCASSLDAHVTRCSRSQVTMPGSMVPERVDITRPSRGVKPIVVSTEAPSCTAATDAPAPR